LLAGVIVGVIVTEGLLQVIVSLLTDVESVTTGAALSFTTFTETFTRQPLLAVNVALYVPGLLKTGFAPPVTGVGFQLYDEMVLVDVIAVVTVVLVQVIDKLFADNETVGVAASAITSIVACDADELQPPDGPVAVTVNIPFPLAVGLETV
jgi:hypothetical protein